MRASSAGKERLKLLETRKILHPKRGYLVYVARYGESRAISGPKGEGGRYFFEVPIVLEKKMTKAELKEWTEEFRRWSKYVVSKAASA